MIPKSYKKQDGCWNCKNRYNYYEYDEDSKIFCTIDKSNRPLNGSIAMGESISDFLKDNSIEYSDPLFNDCFFVLMNNWEKWSEEHKVQFYGICISHLKEVKNANT